MNTKSPMSERIRETVGVLDRSPQLLRVWLHGLPEPLVTDNEGPDTFSARDVVAHLVQAEEDDWMPRVRMLMQHGEERAFVPFDRFDFRQRYEGAAMSEMLDRFDDLRGMNLIALRAMGLRDEDMERKGVHPDFGVVTLNQLLSTWVVHDLSHLGQIARVMAKHMAEDVGPWRAYLPILDR